MDWETILPIGLLALFIGAAIGDSLNNPSKKPPCEFCKHDDVIKAYRRGRKDEKRLANYCPLCGRKIRKIEEDEK